MIKDTITNKETYAALSHALVKAIDYCAQMTREDFREQTVEIEGRNIFAMHQTYKTKSKDHAGYESHRKYIDIQFILDGKEIIRVADQSRLSLTKEYDSQKDISFYDSAVDGTDVKLQAGDFVILFPQDAHMPMISYGKSEQVQKIVVKVAL